MSQSLAVLYAHLIFSTKGRHPFLTDKNLRAEIHNYLGGISSHLGSTPTLVGGTEDHVHILARQAKTVAPANWVRDLKANSTAWIKERDRSLLAGRLRRLLDWH